MGLKQATEGTERESSERKVQVKLSQYCHACANGERRNSSSFLTLALAGGEWSISCLVRALLLGKGFGIHFTFVGGGGIVVLGGSESSSILVQKSGLF
jgi:hypothetical protein